MKRREDSINATILAAFILVSIIVIIFAAVKSCNEEPPKETIETPIGTMPVTTTTHEPEEREWEAEFRAQVSAQVDHEPERTYIGSCRITVYTPHEDEYGYHTATGERSQHLMTCAVDPTVIPYGSNVIIHGKNGKVLRLKAIDCGGAVKGNHIDVFYDGTETGGAEWAEEYLGEYAEVEIEVTR